MNIVSFWDGIDLFSVSLDISQTHNLKRNVAITTFLLFYEILYWYPRTTLKDITTSVENKIKLFCYLPFAVTVYKLFFES